LTIKIYQILILCKNLEIKNIFKPDIEIARVNCSYFVQKSGPDERSIPGNTVAVQADMPFSGLNTFGTSFLSKFECSQMPHPVRIFYT